MDVKNENDLRSAAAVINRDMIGLCNSKTVNEATELFERVCQELTDIYMYKVAKNEENN